MIAGSLLWTGGVFLLWFLGTLVLIPLLGERDWLKPESAEIRTEMIKTYLGEDVEEAIKKSANRIGTTRMLFIHNSRVILLIYVLAVALAQLAPKAAPIIPCLVILLNIIPNIIAIAFLVAFVRQLGLDLGTLLIALLPHGIFEISAICAILGHSVWFAIAGSGDQSRLLDSLVFVAVAELVILLAAIVEAGITPILVRKRLATIGWDPKRLTLLPNGGKDGRQSEVGNTSTE